MVRVGQSAVRMVNGLRRKMSQALEYDLNHICPGLDRSSVGLSLPEDMSCGSRGYFQVASVQPRVYILNTKTRPKLISFTDASGRSRKWLVKGREDIAVDSAVMQLFREMNSYLVPAGLAPINTVSVYHFGGDCGAVDWVPRSSTLLDVLKQSGQVQEGFLASHAAAIEQELVRANLPPKIARKDWPLSITTSVFERLTAKSRSLHLSLRKAIYSSSPSASRMWGSTRTLWSTFVTSSTAGFLCGLGDRHLGNILVDLDTGKLTHVDCSVAFHAGELLPVPENIPFRCTPILREAMIQFLDPADFALSLGVAVDDCLHALSDAMPSLWRMLTELARHGPLPPTYSASIKTSAECRSVVSDAIGIASLLTSVLDAPTSSNNASGFHRTVELLAKLLSRVMHRVKTVPECSAAVESSTDLRHSVSLSHSIIANTGDRASVIEEAKGGDAAEELKEVTVSPDVKERCRHLKEHLEACLLKQCCDVEGVLLVQPPLDSMRPTIETCRSRLGSTRPGMGAQLVADATSVEHLSKLYEGWAAWI